MSDTLNLQLPYLAASQAQKHVTHNEALTLLDGLVHLAVKSRVLATPPGSPDDGDRYLLPASPTGVWAGQAGKLALRMEGTWRFLTAREGWNLWVDDENVSIAFDGNSWNSPGAPSELQNLSLLGVNAAADATNKLSVASASVLFNHAGAGQQLKLNKNALADTASVLWQTGFSGRAEWATAGDDDFHLKVSANGSSWNEALVVAADSGLVTARKTLRLEPQAGDPSSPLDGQLWYDSTSGKLRARQGGASLDVMGSGGGLANAYANITDGTNTASAAAADSFKLRAGTGLAVLVASNDPTHGDNAQVQFDMPGLSVLASPAIADEVLAYDASAGAHVRLGLDDMFKVVSVLTEDVTPDPINDEVPTYDSSAAAARRASPRNLDFALARQRARMGFSFFTDFLQETSATATDNGLAESNSGTGTATTAIASTAVNVVGVAQSSTGTTATGRAALASSLSAVRLGGGDWFFECHVAVPTLSTATERFQVAIGFIDSVAAANQTDAAYFLYDEGGVSAGSAISANWQCVTASNAIRTFTTTTSAVGTGFVRLGVEVNAAGTSVVFSINGTAVATHTTNIPTGAGRETGFGTLLIKSIGTTARTLNCDYINVVSKFTTLR